MHHGRLTRGAHPILATAGAPLAAAYVERGRRAAWSRGGRLVCAAGAAVAGPAPAARSNAPQIKGAAARSASVIIIMQALQSARDSGEWATRAARAPRRLAPPLATPSHPHTPTAPTHLSSVPAFTRSEFAPFHSILNMLCKQEVKL